MEEQQQSTTQVSKSKSGPMVAIVGLIVIVVVGVFAYQNMNKQQTQNTPAVTEQTQQPTQPSQETATQPTTGGATQAAGYKDGTYTALGNYTSPGGAEELGVTLTIAEGVVTVSEVEVKATRPISKTRQTDFAENYESQVVGKNIDELTLTKVSGSSLSPKGFNDAVEKIKAQAQQT